MLELKRVRRERNEVCKALSERGLPDRTEELLALDEQRRNALNASEESKAKRNAAAKKIGAAKDKREADLLVEHMRALNTDIERMDAVIAELDIAINGILSGIPNLPRATVPKGSHDEGSAEAACLGEPRRFAWEPKTAHELCVDLGLTMPVKPAASKLDSQHIGKGATLKRAIINYLLDALIDDGYTEADVVQPASLYRDVILNGDALPVRLCGYTATFSKDNCTEDLLAVFHITGNSFDDQRLPMIAEQIAAHLSALGISCRITDVCSGQLPFEAAQACRIDVWMPSAQKYVPTALCCDHDTFIARRSGIRCRCTHGEKPQYAQTIGCDGIKIDTVLAAVLESGQNGDGSVTLPDMLRAYMHADTIG